MRDESPRWWGLVAAVVVVVVTLLAPTALRSLNVAWFKLGRLMGRVVGPVFMAMMYFLVITPIGVLMRATGSDPLGLRRDPTRVSYWIERTPPGPTPESMRKPY